MTTEQRPNQETSMLWCIIYRVLLMGGSPAAALRDFSDQELRAVCDILAKALPQLPNFLRQLGLPPLPEGDSFWGDQIAPALAREIQRRKWKRK